MEERFLEFLAVANRMLPDGYEVTEHNEPLIKLMIRWFMSDESIEHEGYSLRKGWAISGPPGSGKDFIFRVFHQMSRGRLTEFSILHCVADVRRGVYNDVYTYIDEVLGYQHVLFSELGDEDAIAYRGIDPMREIIHGRYYKKDSAPGIYITHFTTNMNPEQLAIRYDNQEDIQMSKTVSRLSGMCNTYYLDSNKDYRRS